jgi:alpha-tubulin suppressor-like RCC1 family protein
MISGRVRLVLLTALAIATAMACGGDDEAPVSPATTDPPPNTTDGGGDVTGIVPSVPGACSSGSIATGESGRHVCALDGQGNVWCWGSNGRGELGLAAKDLLLSPVPVKVPLPGRMRRVSAGQGFSCALGEDGSIHCWGAWKGDSKDQTLPTQISAPGDVYVQIASAYIGRSCAVRNDGAALCWGSNNSGYLGNGQLGGPAADKPSQVIGLTSDVAQVTAGLGHACARKTNGEVWCWGWQYNGTLGQPDLAELTCNDAGTDCNATKAVNTGVTNAVDIAAGGTSTCAVMKDGTVSCWGGGMTHVALASVVNSAAPLQVPGVAGATRVWTSGSNACALLSGGVLACWGYNQSGSLARTDMNYDYELDGKIKTLPPLPAKTNAGVIDVALETGTMCVRKDDGHVACFGENFEGQRGDGTTTDSAVPIEVVAAGKDNAQVVVGSSTTCVRKVSGTVQCWGYNQNSELAVGNVHTVTTPTDVAGISGVTQLIGGDEGRCAVTNAGADYSCWGVSQAGELGIAGPYTVVSTPTKIAFLGSTRRQLRFTSAHACVTNTDDTLDCYGKNQDWQLGREIPAASSDPLRVESLGATVAEAVPGGTYTLVRTTANKVFWFGWKGQGVLGAKSATPIEATALGTDVAELATGVGNHGCARKTNGTVMCWGYGNDGALGDGNFVFESGPVVVADLNDAVELAVGIRHACARRTNGEVVCWGSLREGMVGDGRLAPAVSDVALASAPKPVAVKGLSNVVQIAASASHSCARTSDGAIHCWGSNGYGQLGNGKSHFDGTPSTVLGVSACR